MHQFRRHGTIDPTANSANNSTPWSADLTNTSNLFPDEFLLYIQVNMEDYEQPKDVDTYHRPIRSALANIDYKTSDELFSLGSMCYFGVELDTVERF